MLALPRAKLSDSYDVDITKVESYLYRYHQLTRTHILQHCLHIGQYHYLPVLQLLLCHCKSIRFTVREVWNTIQMHDLFVKEFVVWRINEKDDWIPYTTYWFYETYLNPLIREYIPQARLTSCALSTDHNHNHTLELLWLCEKSDDKDKYQIVFGRHYDILCLQDTSKEPTGGIVFMEHGDLMFEQGIFPDSKRTMISMQQSALY